jgi:protein-S-isoprenylcysteine O-methyltransferase Ste14
MPTVYRYLFPAMWLGWAGYWWFSSRDVKPTLLQESLPSRLSYVAPLIIAGALLSMPKLPVPGLEERFRPLAGWPFVLAAAMTAAGLLFSVWARRYLGTNWSGRVTIKERHELITRGPYGLVRHPIYTGVLLAILGSVIAVGEWRAVFAMVLASLALWRKLRLEERWMLRQFGDVYKTYCRRVPALIPFSRKPGTKNG